MYIGIDVGGSKIRVASFSSIESPEILEKREFETLDEYEKDLENIEWAIGEVADKVRALGIGLPGVLDDSKEVLVNAPNLSTWDGQPVVRQLKEKYPCLIAAENDTLVAALAEGLYGYAGKRDFTFIIWGTGIGGAVVKEVGEELELTSFEPGHQIVVWKGEPDGCGQTGCLQAYCGGNGIEQRYGKTPAELSDDEWLEVVAYLGQGLINIIAIRHPRQIIFGGGIAIRQPERIRQLVSFVENQLAIYSPPEIRLTEFGENLGLFGAIALLR